VLSLSALSRVQNKVADFFFVLKKLFVFLEVFKHTHEDNPHPIVHAINYVHPVFFSPENHAAIHVFFKFVQLAEVGVGTIQDITHNRFCFVIVFQIFEKPLSNNHARYMRSNLHEMAVTIDAMVFLFDARILWFDI
jgi:hypothetical protein